MQLRHRTVKAYGTMNGWGEKEGGREGGGREGGRSRGRRGEVVGWKRKKKATHPTGSWITGGSGRLSTAMEILQGVKVVGEERVRVTVLST